MQSPIQEFADVAHTADDKIVSLSQFDWQMNNFICLEMARVIENCNFPATSVELRPHGADHRGHINQVSLTLVGPDEQASTKIIKLHRPVVRSNDKFITL